MLTSLVLKGSYIRNFPEDGDFAVRVPTTKVGELVDKVKGVVDLSPAIDAFQEKGFSIYYDGLNNLDVRFYRFRSNSLVCFRYLNEPGYKKLLEIAFGLGIDLNQTPKYTK